MAITQPADKDRLVLDALAQLLSSELDPFFSDHSQGFRPRHSVPFLGK